MIITRTPFRISFVGGGTDFPDFFMGNKGGGAVVSTTINKYIYVTANPKFDDRIHLRYSVSECVERLSDLKHNIVRTALMLSKIGRGIEITTISDIPCTGSGLGSSSTLSVGVLKTLAGYKYVHLNPDQLANMAAMLEIEHLGHPIGLQDQYAAAYGGLNLITFKNDGTVNVERLNRRSDYYRLQWLNQSTLLFYLGFGRESNAILENHKKAISETREKYIYMEQQRNLTCKFVRWLEGHWGSSEAPAIIAEDDKKECGKLITESWKLKKTITPDAETPEIKRFMEDAFDAGALGAKVCGAGAGGFMLIICDPYNQPGVRRALSGLKELHFGFEHHGSQVVYTNGHTGSIR